MSGSTFGHLFHVTNFGESHGPAIGCVIDGCPPGMALSEGDIQPEVRGRDFFPYKPRHLASAPPRPALARVTNIAQQVMASGKYDGAILTQGSPAVEETAYWLNLQNR